MNASPPMPAAQSATDYARFESPDGTCVWVDPARAEIVAIAYVDGPVPDYSPAQARALARIVARLNDNVLLNVDLRASGTFRLCEVSGTLFMERRLPAPSGECRARARGTVRVAAGRPSLGPAATPPQNVPHRALNPMLEIFRRRALRLATLFCLGAAASGLPIGPGFDGSASAAPAYAHAVQF